MTDLNSLVKLPAGWVITEGKRINDRGQILAEVYAIGKRKAVLLSVQ